MKSSGFIGGNISSCLYVKKSIKDIVYISQNSFMWSVMWSTQRTLGLRSNPRGIQINPGRSYVLAIVTMQETWWVDEALVAF